MPEKPKVYIQTFYGFDVFVNGQMIYFPSKKIQGTSSHPHQSKRRERVSERRWYIFYMNNLERRASAKRNVRVVYHRLTEDAGGIWMSRNADSQKEVYFPFITEWFECDLYEFVKGNEKLYDLLIQEHIWRNIRGPLPPVPYLDKIYARMNDNDKTRRKFTARNGLDEDQDTDADKENIGTDG
ncbi:MAG: hypothetical protein ACLTW9_22940 [Enterocloster sp.]